MFQVHHTIGVIAGTPFDTGLGVARAQELGLKVLPHPISLTPENQTLT